MVEIYKNGKLVKLVSSAIKAEKFTGVHRSTVSDAIKDGRTRKGYTFVRPDQQRSRMARYIVTKGDEKIECLGMSEVCEVTGYTAAYARSIAKSGKGTYKIERVK